MSRLRFAVAIAACITIAAAVGGQDKQGFTPKFKDDKGNLTPYYQQSTTKVIQAIKVQGQDLTQTQESTFWYKWEPLPPEGEKWKIKQTVEGLRMSIDISGNAIVYDTRNKDTSGSASNPGLINFFKNLEGSSFTATLTKDFKVESVDQRDKDAFLSKLAANNGQMDALLKKILTDDALKQMVDPTLGVIPDQPQAIGGTWSKKTPLNLGPVGTYDVTYNFKYVGKDRDLDKIEVTTSLSYAPPKEGAEGLLFRIKSGTLASKSPTPGTILYNPRTGRIEKAEIKLIISGDLVVIIGNAETNVHLDQEQTTTIETRDTSFLAPPAPPAPPEKK